MSEFFLPIKVISLYDIRPLAKVFEIGPCRFSKGQLYNAFTKAFLLKVSPLLKVTFSMWKHLVKVIFIAPYEVLMDTFPRPLSCTC